MIEVSEFKVRTFDLDHLDLFWKIQDTDDVIERYAFYVLRSIDGYGGPFETIAGPFNNTFQFRDPNVQLLHKWREYFYKIRVEHKDRPDYSREFGPEWLRAQPDRMALEIQRRMFLVLKEFNGRKCLLFPRLTFGQRCPHCFKKGTRGNYVGSQNTSNCQTCYDTTYVSGYANPIAIWVQFDPAPKKPQVTDQSEHVVTMSSGRTGAWPPIRPRDMIVEAENRRWLVESAPRTEKLRATVHQELEMREIARDDVRYQIPISLDLLDDFSPEREFTRPKDVGFDLGQ